MSTDLLSLEHPSVLLFCLVNLSPRLKCTFVDRPSFVNFSHFRLLLSVKPLNGVQRNLNWQEQDLNFIYQVSVFGPIRKKTRLPPEPLICWDIFDFSSGTTKRNSAKLDWKEDSMSSIKFVFFGPIRKIRGQPLASQWLRHFRLLLWHRWTEFNETWQEARYQHPPTTFMFLGLIRKRKWQPWSIRQMQKKKLKRKQWEKKRNKRRNRKETKRNEKYGGP